MTRAQTLKHRLGLWLRSERALGLPSVPGAPRPLLPLPVQGPAGPAMRQPVAGPSPRAISPAPVRPTPVRQPAQTSFLPSVEPDMAKTPLLPVMTTPLPAELPGPEKIKLLAELDRTQVSGCIKCDLCKSRNRTVFGEGDPDAEICFVGEGPGKDEDASGRPFVGRAGQKLDDMIHAMGLRRDQVFICNIVKCRAFIAGPPPKDRPPTDDEVATCSPYLTRQLELVHPRVIVTLGLPATRFMLSSKLSMSMMRGKWHNWRGIKVMPTWHPAYVLRNYTVQTRAEVWNDLKQVLVELNLPIPNRSGQ